jgi:FkbM family methyltransferase
LIFQVTTGKENMPSKQPSNLDEFYKYVLTNSIASLKLNTFLDNFDARRYNHDGVDRSKLFDASAHASYFDWFFNNHKSLYDAYLLFDDQKSRRLYLHLIAFRLAGHFSVRLPVDFANNEDAYSQYMNQEKFSESTLETDGRHGKLKHFDFIFEGKRYIVDCVSLESYLFNKQYFYDSDGVRICPELNDVVIDGGACLGDTAIVFSNAVGPNGKVYSFDPVFDHLEILKFNVSQFPNKNVFVMPYGLSDQNIACDPMRIDRYLPGFCSENQEVPLRSIDHLLSSGEIADINFIKLDVEGFEMNVIRGANYAINILKPKLAISLYHKPNDIFEIPLYIRDKYPFYKQYLNHYTIHNEETVLYCTI